VGLVWVSGSGPDAAVGAIPGEEGAVGVGDNNVAGDEDDDEVLDDDPKAWVPGLGSKSQLSKRAGSKLFDQVRYGRKYGPPMHQAPITVARRSLYVLLCIHYLVYKIPMRRVTIISISCVLKTTAFSYTTYIK
jgi:hypothetical protein